MFVHVLISIQSDACSDLTQNDYFYVEMTKDERKQKKRKKVMSKIRTRLSYN